VAGVEIFTTGFRPRRIRRGRNEEIRGNRKSACHIGKNKISTPVLQGGSVEKCDRFVIFSEIVGTPRGREKAGRGTAPTKSVECSLQL
jgi:hypothetical protein